MVTHLGSQNAKNGVQNWGRSWDPQNRFLDTLSPTFAPQIIQFLSSSWSILIKTDKNWSKSIKKHEKNMDFHFFPVFSLLAKKFKSGSKTSMVRLKTRNFGPTQK